MHQAKPSSSTVTIQRVTGQPELIQALTIRIRVFVLEQSVPAEIELDADDRHAIHLLALRSGKAVGTARVVIKHGKAKIGRMAVLRSYRRKGVGTALLKRALALGRRAKTRQIYLNAQMRVAEFYERLGFRAVGKVFIEAGIRHRRMVFIKRIDSS